MSFHSCANASCARPRASSNSTSSRSSPTRIRKFSTSRRTRSRILVERIRRERPSIVITFDPHGVTMRVDHIAQPLRRPRRSRQPRTRAGIGVGRRVCRAATPLDASRPAWDGALPASARRRLPDRSRRRCSLRAAAGARGASRPASARCSTRCLWQPGVSKCSASTCCVGRSVRRCLVGRPRTSSRTIKAADLALSACNA